MRRTANLLQVSSAFGRAMERVDRTAVCRAVFPVLARWRAEGVDEGVLRRVVAAPGAAGRLREAVAGLPPEMALYKSIAPFRDALLGALPSGA